MAEINRLVNILFKITNSDIWKWFTCDLQVVCIITQLSPLTIPKHREFLLPMPPETVMETKPVGRRKA